MVRGYVYRPEGFLSEDEHVCRGIAQYCGAEEVVAHRRQPAAACAERENIGEGEGARARERAIGATR